MTKKCVGEPEFLKLVAGQLLGGTSRVCAKMMMLCCQI